MKRAVWVGVSLLVVLVAWQLGGMLDDSPMDGRVHKATDAHPTAPERSAEGRTHSQGPALDGAPEPFDITVWGVVDMYVSNAWRTCSNAPRSKKAERNLRTWPLMGKETAQQREDLVTGLAESNGRSWVKACAWVFEEEVEGEGL